VTDAFATGDGSLAEPVILIDPDPAYDVIVYSGKVCNVEGCEHRCPAKGEPGYASARVKCDEHYVGSKKAGSKKHPRDDAAPMDVSINLGTGSKGSTVADKKVAKVTAGATQMVQTVGAIMFAMGNQADGVVVLNGAEAWGKAIGDLSRYQPMLEKIFAPAGEMTGQALAWVAVMAATAGIVIPVLHNHGLVSDTLAATFGATTIAMAGGVPSGDGG
jgi:hypothetical protein